MGGGDRVERADLALAGAIGLSLAVLYAIGACRTIYVGDSGELAAAAATLGIPHPSGYPLYVLLGKLWTLLVPAGSVAFRLSLFSAAAAAAAAALTVLAARTAGLGRLAAAFAALTLGLGPSFWSQATIQRVYALNALFLMATLWLVLVWRRREGVCWLLAAAFTAALGATNHTFMGVVWVVVLVWAAAAAPRRVLTVRTLAGVAAVTAAGLLPYLYLPLRSAQQPRLDWGDPESLDAFLAVVLRRDFWDRRFLESAADLVPIAADYLRSLAAETAWAGATLAALAVAARRAHRLPVALPLAVMAANLATMAAHGSRADLFIWHRYYIPSYAMLALLAAAGLEVLAGRLGRRLVALALLAPLLLAATGFRAADRSRYRVAEDFSRRLLASLPPGSTLAASDDNILFVLIYLTMVEGVRPDVDVILQGVGGADLPTLRFDPVEQPVFFTHHPNWPEQATPGLAVVPAGLAYRVWRSDRPPPPVAVPSGPLVGELDDRVAKDYLTWNLIGHYHFMTGMTLADRAWPEAEAALRRARAAARDNDVLFYNLGLVYRRAGLPGRALAAFARAAAINPRHLASAARPRPADRVAEASAELAAARALVAQLVARDPSLAAAPPGSPERLRGEAAALAAAGRPDLARGRELCAEEVATGVTPAGDCDAL